MSSPSPSLELDVMSGSSTGDPVGVSLSSKKINRDIIIIEKRGEYIIKSYVAITEQTK